MRYSIEVVVPEGPDSANWEPYSEEAPSLEIAISIAEHVGKGEEPGPSGVRVIDLATGHEVWNSLVGLKEKPDD